MKNIVKILIGFFIILSALVGYNFNPAYMYQLTFISNALCGLLLMTDGLVVMITKKSLPVILYQFVLPCILTSFCSVFLWYSDGMTSTSAVCFSLCML